jgi:hypothetical protein
MSVKQAVNTVYKTNDLSIFKQIKGNRPPNPQHIKRLCSSIKEHGILQNPIIVNEDMIVIDGQHRLLAAKESNSSIYYIIVYGYKLDEVQILNLNQKNWTKKDFLEGYADMGVESYIKLRNFFNKNNDFNLRDCIAMCSNVKSASTADITQKYRVNKTNTVKMAEVFEEGTWKGKDFNLAQQNADKIKLIKPLYNGFKRSSFIMTMLGMFQKEEFSFVDFLNKLSMQPNKLVDCTSVEQYKVLIEDIYNYRRRDKVNLRF